MDVQRFEPSTGAEVASWPAGEAECLAWCSAPSVDGADVVAWGSDDDVEAWVLVEAAVPIAYGEIWVDNDEREVELAHLIVSPDRRGRGVGRRLVDALAELGLQRHDLLVMRVRPDNHAARRCYAAAGFERVSDGEEAAWNVGQPTDYVWMRRSRQT